MNEQQFEKGLIKAGAKSVSDQDIAKVVTRSDEIKKKFRPGGPLQRFIVDGQLLISMIKDYWARRYRQVPVGVVGAVVFTLLYVFNPLDLVPDVLPIVGQLDDAALVAACLMLVEHDLRTYESWKATAPEQPSLPPGPSDTTK
ncbi:MAG TPA: DUF1232 domain-containing protein [Anaerolineales bacterium]